MMSLLSSSKKISNVFTFKYRGKSITVNPHKELAISSEDINNELKNQSRLFFVVNEAYSESLVNHRMASKEVDRIYAYIFCKEKLGKDTEYVKKHFKSPSDDYAKSAAIKSGRYQEALEKEIEAEKIMNDLKSLSMAVNHRLKMLEQVSINTRKENN